MRIKFSSRITEQASRGVFEAQPDEPDEVLARERRNEAVSKAIASLSDSEQLLVRRYHFEGASLRQIADDLGLGLQSVMNSHKRALRKLRKLLMTFAGVEFGMPRRETACVICSSPHRTEIDQILTTHVVGEPYRGIMHEVRKRFNVEIVSVMTIVGHCKYHS